MRLVIELYGRQGRTLPPALADAELAFLMALTRQPGHDWLVVVSDQCPDRIDEVRALLGDQWSRERIRVWSGPPADLFGEDRDQVMAALRTAFIRALEPDVLHSASPDRAGSSGLDTGPGQPGADPIMSRLVDGWIHPIPDGPAIPARTADWDTIAAAAVAIWEATLRETAIPEAIDGGPAAHRRPRLALVSPLPPVRSGIARYTADLLPALSAYYDIDLVVDQERVEPAPGLEFDRVRDSAWLRANAHRMDRVLYQVGNAEFHGYMLDLIATVPGVVILHDCCLGHLLGAVEAASGEHLTGVWSRALAESHGYAALQLRFFDPQKALWRFPVSLPVIASARAVIVHSEHARSLLHDCYGAGPLSACSVVPLARSLARPVAQVRARADLGLDPQGFIVVSVGFLGQTKLSHRVLQAWQASALGRDPRSRLLFVGELPGDDYGRTLMQMIKCSGCGERIQITGYVPAAQFRQYLAAADLAVQLRTASRGESSATVLDTMSHGLPLIVNAHGSMAELDPDSVCMLPDGFADEDLVAALETLAQCPELRHRLGENARKQVATHHTPQAVARRYTAVIEAACRSPAPSVSQVVDWFGQQPWLDDSMARQRALATALAANHPVPGRNRCLYLDVSATAQHDLHTGIERVARALVMALIEHPPVGWRVEPVALTRVDGSWQYRCVRGFVLGLLGVPAAGWFDELTDMRPGDCLVTLDLYHDGVIRAARNGVFDGLRRRGIHRWAVVHDLLPIRMPGCFPEGTDRNHRRWLEVVSGFDGLLCISGTVAADVRAWQQEQASDPAGRPPCQVEWFHLGADLTASAPSRGLDDTARSALARMRERPTVLMVGTIEPRKGHLQVLDAFERLWQAGIDINLVVVGRPGWQGLPAGRRRNIPETLRRLRSSPELDRRLIWLDNLSDEGLVAVMQAGSCLITASYGEGFGLPVIEAARHGLTILARDLPVFREVAGESALYFPDERSPEAIVAAVREWLLRREQGMLPVMTARNWPTWKESADQFWQRLGRHLIGPGSRE